MQVIFINHNPYYRVCFPPFLMTVLVQIRPVGLLLILKLQDTIQLFIFLKHAHSRGFRGRKYKCTEKTDLLTFTHYILIPVAYFPIIVRNFLNRFFW